MTIDEAIVAVMREVGAIGKEKKNQQQGFNYRGIEDIYNRVQPLMARHGIYTAPKVTDVQRDTGTSKSGGTLFYCRLVVDYEFRSEDGSSVTVTVAGEAMDNADKGSNKAMAAAHKYAICQVFNIPYEVIDPDQFTPDWAVKDEGIGISRRQFDELKSSWWATVKDDLEQADGAERAQAFREWAADVLGHDFMAANYREWTADDLAECRKRLNEAGAAALAASGLKKNGGSK